MALVPHSDTLSGKGPGNVARALLAASGTLLGRGEIALSRFTERRLRIAAFPRPTYCARCYRYDPKPGALLRQKPREPQLMPEWWCEPCLERAARERRGVSLEMEALRLADLEWQAHVEACPACRRWGTDRALALRYCPTRGAA